MSDYYDTFVKKLLSKKAQKELKSHELNKLFERPKKETKIEMPHFNSVMKPNIVQQCDLLFLPNDRGYRYLLVVVDTYDSRTDAEPLKHKHTDDVLNAFKTIYKRGILKIPSMYIQCDDGGEFKGVVRDYFHSHRVMIRVGKVGRHRQQAYVESKNRLIGSIITKRMTAEELLTGERGYKWKDEIPKIIKMINEKLTHVHRDVDDKDGHLKPPIIGGNEDVLRENDKVRVMLQEPKTLTGEKLHGKFRASDIRWEPEIRTVKNLQIAPNMPILYILDGTERVAYSRKQLQRASTDDVKPHSKVIREKVYIVEKILDMKKKNGKKYYKVKWRDYPVSQATYEPRSELVKNEGVRDLINSFEKKYKI